MKKFFKYLLIFFLVVLVGCITAVVIFFKSKLNKINYENLSVEEIEINEGIEEKLDDYTNIALLGLDAQDNTFDNSRSDCIMIISINNKTNEVKIASVYRDTYLNIAGHGLDKITHAYAFGKAKLALNSLNTNLDLNITQYVTINFDSVISIVDAIGGVQVTLSQAEANYVPGINSAGTYNLTGQQALAYGRIRKIDSDYVRTERMRNVVIKVFEKVKRLSYTQLNSLIDRLLPEITTNITQTEILSYASKITSYNVTDNFGWPYNVKSYTGAAWYAAPVTLQSNVEQLHKDLFGDENYEASNKVKEISQSIINKTNYTN